MFSHSQPLRALAAGFAIVFVLSCVSTDLAQSGRRARSTPPAPVSTPEPTPTPNASSEKPKPRLTFLVGLDSHGGFANIPFYAYDGVLRSLADRLARAPGIHVGGTQSDMSHIDAIRKAKAEKEAYVVWVQLEVDTMGSSSGNSRNLENIVIEYTVLAPTTAKVSKSGRTYPQRNRSIIFDPRSSGIYGDRYLNQAAEAAADRILAHFHIRAAPIRLP